MSDKQNDTENTLFDELGLSLTMSDVEVGQIYPIYGAITKFVSSEPGNVVVLINDQIEATMSLLDDDKIETLRKRTFDTGIFVCTIKEVTPTIKADCTTVVFGKNNDTVQ